MAQADELLAMAASTRRSAAWVLECAAHASGRRSRSSTHVVIGWRCAFQRADFRVAILHPPSIRVTFGTPRFAVVYRCVPPRTGVYRCVRMAHCHRFLTLL